MSKNRLGTTITYIIILGFIMAFFAWSGLIWVSLLMLIVLDSLTLKWSTGKLKEKLPEKLYRILKYSCLIAISVLFAIFIRTFFFDIYFVPSSSMERTLFPNDYVIVNKASFGTKIPKRIQDVPIIGGLFKERSTSHEYDLYRSLKGFKSYERDDIVVFKSIIDNNKFLIKRIIGMPGETLKIEDSKVSINNQLLEERDLYCYGYIDSTQNKLPLSLTYSNKEFTALSLADRKNLKKNIFTKPSRSFYVFPYTKQKEWTRDNYGPIKIPKKGMTITLNETNLEFYKAILRNYENEEIKLSDNATKTYTFKNNYYFMMGDNRHGSIDSRVFGFVPESYIQGKLIYVFSKKRIID